MLPIALVNQLMGDATGGGRAPMDMWMTGPLLAGARDGVEQLRQAGWHSTVLPPDDRDGASGGETVYRQRIQRHQLPRAATSP
jgi:hypothetical protein